MRVFCLPVLLSVLLLVERFPKVVSENRTWVNSGGFMYAITSNEVEFLASTVTVVEPFPVTWVLHSQKEKESYKKWSAKSADQRSVSYYTPGMLPVYFRTSADLTGAGYQLAVDDSKRFGGVAYPQIMLETLTQQWTFITPFGWGVRLDNVKTFVDRVGDNPDCLFNLADLYEHGMGAETKFGMSTVFSNGSCVLYREITTDRQPGAFFAQLMSWGDYVPSQNLYNHADIQPPDDLHAWFNNDAFRRNISHFVEHPIRHCCSTALNVQLPSGSHANSASGLSLPVRNNSRRRLSQHARQSSVNSSNSSRTAATTRSCGPIEQSVQQQQS
eukprot:Lankesteria_metandrocarpae@DN9449_c0_g1_i1.p1